MTRRVPCRRSALEEHSRKGAPPVRFASNLDNYPFKRRKRHLRKRQRIELRYCGRSSAAYPVTSTSTAGRNGQKRSARPPDSFSSAVKPVMLAREDDAIDQNL